MWTLPYSAPQKLGIIIRGLAAGVGTAILTSACLFLIGLGLSLMGNAGWIHLGESQPWLPIAGLEYGFLFGLVIGAIVCWKVWRSQLHRASE